MQWLLPLIAAPVVWWVFMVMWREASAEVALLIDSVVQNSLENLGYKPDGASLVFLARHPFLARRIWRMLGDGGAANFIAAGPVSEESEESCERLLRYVSDESFKRRFPAAGALMQCAVYLCDRHSRCSHPKDELVADHTEND